MFRSLLLFAFFVYNLKALTFPVLGPASFDKGWNAQIEAAYQNLKEEDYVRAKTQFYQLSKSKERAIGLYYLAMTYLQLEQIDRAYELINQLKDLSDSYGAYNHAKACYNLALGRYFLKRNKYNQAKDLFESALGIEKSNDIRLTVSQIYLDRVKFWKRGRDRVKKKELLTDSLSLNPLDEQTLSDLSSLYIEDNDFNSARPYLETLVQRFPDRDRRFRLAVVFTYTDQILSAYKILEELKTEFPNDAEINEKYLQIRQFVTLRSDDSQSVSLTNETTSQSKKSSEILNRIRAMIMKKDLDSASKILEEAREIEPDNWLWLKEWIQIRVLKQEYEIAIQVLEENRARFSKSFEYHLEMARLLEVTNETEALHFVLTQLRSSKWENWQQKEFRLILGKIHLKTGKRESAREVFEEISSQDEKDHASRFYLGVYYGQIRNFPKSLEAYKAAYNLDPSNPKYLLAIATTLRQLGLEKEATEIYERLENRFPDSKFTQYARKLFQAKEPEKNESESNQESKSLPAYLRVFLYFQKQNPMKEELSQILPLLSLTKRWDLLIEEYEGLLLKDSNQPEIHQELENLYSTYPSLDRAYTLSSSAIESWIAKNAKEKQFKDILDFFQFLDPGVSLAPSVKFHFADAFFNAKYFEPAQKLLEDLVLEGEEKVTYYSMLGHLHFIHKRHQEALNAYYQALSLDPANLKILFQMAELLRTTGEIQKARLIYEEILLMKPDQKIQDDARFYLKQIEK